MRWEVCDDCVDRQKCDSVRVWRMQGCPPIRTVVPPDNSESWLSGTFHLIGYNLSLLSGRSKMQVLTLPRPPRTRFLHGTSKAVTGVASSSTGHNINPLACHDPKIGHQMPHAIQEQPQQSTGSNCRSLSP